MGRAPPAARFPGCSESLEGRVAPGSGAAMKISVVVPTYNRSRFAARAIISLTEQTLAPGEIIVMDNGSTDDTGVVVRELASGVRRLRHIVEPRLGVSLVRNAAAGRAPGDLVPL